MTSIPPVVVRFSVEGEGAVTAASGRVQKALSGLDVVVRRLAGAYGLLRIVRFADDALEAAASLHELSQRTGATVKALSILQFAAKRANVSTEELAVGFKGLSLSLAQLRGGGKEAVAAFQAVGLSANDLKGLTVDQTFLKIVDALARLPDGFLKAEVASKIFGRSGAALIPLLDDLAHNGFEKAAAAAEKLGAVITDDAAKAADEFKDRLGDLKLQAEGTARAILNPLIPSLIQLTAVVGELFSRKPGDTFKHDIEDITRLIDKITGGSAYATFRKNNPNLFPVSGATGPSPNRDLGHRAAPFVTPPKETLKVVHQLTDAERQHLELIRAEAQAAGELLKIERARQIAAEGARDATHSQFVEALRQTGGVGSFEELIARQQAQARSQGPGGLSVTEQVARDRAEAQADVLAYVRELQSESDATILAFQNIGQSLRESVAGELADFFTDGIAQAKSFGDAIGNLAQTVIRSIQQIVAQLVAAQIVKGIASAIFGGGIPGAPDVGNIGDSLNGVPMRFHSGGMIPGSGEVPIIGLAGEMVMNREATAAHFQDLMAWNRERASGRNFGPRRYHDGGMVAAPAGSSGSFSGNISLDRGLVMEIVNANFPIFLENHRKTGQRLFG